MKTADKQKMCANCHGRIPIDAETCLYCGQEQIDHLAETSGQTTLFEQQSLQESLTSLYSPPYGSKRPAREEPSPQPARIQPPTREIPELKRPFAQKEEALSYEEDEERVQEEATAPAKWGIFSLLLMILGANIFTVGLMQLFFSDGGALRLEWQTDNWYFYCLAAVPLLFVGFRLASKLKT